MDHNANAWSSISDSTKKENYKNVDGGMVLEEISRFNLGSWNYKGQAPEQYRHYGPMAQEFYASFGHDGIGTIGNDTLLNTADVDGILFIAIKALEKRTEELTRKMTEIEESNRIIIQLIKENMELKSEVAVKRSIYKTE